MRAAGFPPRTMAPGSRAVVTLAEPPSVCVSVCVRPTHTHTRHTARPDLSRDEPPLAALLLSLSPSLISLGAPGRVSVDLAPPLRPRPPLRLRRPPPLPFLRRLGPRPYRPTGGFAFSRLPCATRAIGLSTLARGCRGWGGWGGRREEGGRAREGRGGRRAAKRQAAPRPLLKGPHGRAYIFPPTHPPPASPQA